MAWKDRIAGRSGQQVLTGANFALYTFIVIALIVLVNWFVNNHDHRWDMTPNKKYSLSEQSHKILKGLKQDVTIYAFEGPRGSGELRDVLGMYSAASNRVKVKYVDPNRQPALAKEFGVRTIPLIVVSAGERHMEAQGENEEGITNALIHVLTGQKSIYFTQGHGEHDPGSSEDMGYSSAKQQMGNENFQVNTVNLAEKNVVPSDCTVLIIAGPQKDFLTQEVDAIRKYVAAGGRVLVLLDALADPHAEKPENLEKLLADWNVTVQADLVIDPSVSIMGAGPGLTVVRKYGTNPIVKPLAGSMTLFPMARSFEIGKESKPGVTDEWLCQTSDEGYGVADFNAKMQDVTFREGKDLKGPINVAIAGTVSGAGEGNPGPSTPGKSGEGRFVAIGTSALAANAYLHVRQFSNLDLFMGSIDWLASQEDLISIRPQPPESQHLSMTSEQLRRVLVLGVLGVPLLIVLAGVLVWWERR
jgi:ABC-type uncharacterized transport system involved in gliding motility auxiliary subunit